MSNWATFGYTGITWGLILCAVTVPLLALAQKIFRQRLRYYWLLVCAAVTLYATGVFAFTMLPLSSAAEVVCSSYPLRLTLFGSVQTALQANAGKGLLASLTSYSFLQIFFNVLLFVPGGFMARAVFKRGVLTSTVLGLGTSLLIETTQLTGFWGYFPCAYRIFDVDDLLTNTTGALAGALLAAAWVALRRRPENPLSAPKLPMSKKIFAQIIQGS